MRYRGINIIFRSNIRRFGECKTFHGYIFSRYCGFETSRGYKISWKRSKIAKFNTFNVTRKHSLQKPVSKEIGQSICKFTKSNEANFKKCSVGTWRNNWRFSNKDMGPFNYYVLLSQNAPNLDPPPPPSPIPYSHLLNFGSPSPPSNILNLISTSISWFYSFIACCNQS